MLENNEMYIELNCKYSLFLLEKHYGEWGSNLTQGCFEYVETYNTLEEAKSAQKEYELKTIILANF
jgi:hypothetical protein